MLARAKRLIGRWLAAAKPARAPKPARSQFQLRRHASPFGARDYKLFIPASWKGAGSPLVLMLHGCRQDPDDFAIGTRMNALAEEHGFLVAWPAQSRIANGLRCWNWFQPAHQARGSGEPAILAGIVQEVTAEFGVDPKRVFAAGLSAGGAMAAVMGEAYPELFAAVGVHSGVPTGVATDLRSAMAAMAGKATRPASATAPGSPVRTIIFHGDHDTTVHHGNGRVPVAQASSKPGPVHRERPVEVQRGEANGRKYTRTLLRDGKGGIVREHWLVHNAGHAWSGGDARGSYADALGPDASREIVRFFLQ